MMPSTALVPALKTVAGGLFVVAFAVVAGALSPKRLAGVFAAAPAVALGSLIMTVLLMGRCRGRPGGRGMAVGGAAFAASCIAGVPAPGRWSALRGAVAVPSR